MKSELCYEIFIFFSNSGLVINYEFYILLVFVFYKRTWQPNGAVFED